MRDGGATRNTEQLDARFGSWKSIFYWCGELLRLTGRGKNGYREQEYFSMCILAVLNTETQLCLVVLSQQINREGENEARRKKLRLESL